MDDLAETILRARLTELLDGAALGEQDNLLEFGLDSIRLMQLSDLLQQSGLVIGFREMAQEPTLGAWLDLLRGREKTAQPAGGAERSGAPAVNPGLPFPLTPVQQSYWIGRGDGQSLGGVGCHAYLELDGAAVDPVRLENAVHALLRRHGMLRARFLPDGTQRILSESPWPGLVLHDLRELTGSAARHSAERIREELAHRRLDVDAGEVFDVRLTLLPGGAGRLHVNIDLLVCDVLSVRLLLVDLAALYLDPATVEPLEYSFPQYLADRAARATADREAAREYWMDRLPSLPRAPALPLALDPSTVTTPRFTRRARVLPAEVWQRLTRRAATLGLTPASVLATAFAEVLARWSGQDRFLLNVPLFDRRAAHPDTARLVADFTSLVLLDVHLTGNGFAERARGLQHRLHEDLEHTAFSGVELLRELARVDGPEPRTAPVVFACNVDGALVAESCREQFGDVGWMISQTPQVWLDHQVHLTADGVLLAWDAVENLFPPGVLDAMFEAYLGLLGRLADTGWEAPAELALPSGQRAVRDRVNETRWPRPPRTLHGTFFERAADGPDRIALCWGEHGSVCYGELADLALRVAGTVRAHGVGRGDLVVLNLPKGADQVAAVLGVLAAGAAYVPVGVDQPPQRRLRMLRAAGAALVLTSRAEDWNGEDIAGTTVMDFGTAVRGAPLAAPERVDPADPAYVMFTSGSTGVPKGVEIAHGAAANTVDDLNDRLGVGPRDRVLAVSALDFDLSVWDLFGMLFAGAGVVLIGEEDRKDPRAWLELGHRHDITLWNSVPVLLDMLLTAAGAGPLPPGLRQALLSGDWIGLELPGKLAAATAGRCALLALGGATEASIWSNAFDVDAAAIPRDWRSIPYGFPLRNQCYRVVDGAGRDCPEWVPGELWIGGAGVATGYRGDPVQTAARFVTRDGARWYRTGDLGRYRPEGLLEFLGRLDQQVKINGHRIELGEVESAVRAHPAVESAVVVRTAEGRLATLLTEPAPRPTPEKPGPRAVPASLGRHLALAGGNADRPLRVGSLGVRDLAEVAAELPPDELSWVVLGESEDLLEQARACLAGHGHAVRAACLAVDAVPDDLLHAFDVVLAETARDGFPGRTAVTVRTLLAPGGTVLAPFPAATGNGTGELTQALTEAGFSDVLTLPLGREGGRLVQAGLAGDAPVVRPEPLREWLTLRLPEHMVPRVLAVAPALPLSANGKVDRRVVAAVFTAGERAGYPVEPVRSGLEQLVAGCWAEVLGQPPAGREDGFFGAGGDSLLATRVIALLRERTGAEVSMREFFREPTARGIAAALAAGLDNAGGGAEEIEEGAI